MHTLPKAVDVVTLSGPEWLFVILRGDAFDGSAWSTLACHVQRLLEKHMRCQLVLDLNRSPRLGGELIGQMLILQGWIDDRGGLMRVCGLSEAVAQMFRCGRLDRIFRVFADIRSAVQGGRPFPERRAVEAESPPACMPHAAPCRETGRLTSKQGHSPPNTWR